jgi:hypothetical protein
MGIAKPACLRAEVPPSSRHRRDEGGTSRCGDVCPYGVENGVLTIRNRYGKKPKMEVKKIL